MPKHRVLITKGAACHHTSPISSVRPARLFGTASAPVASLCTLMPAASCALWASRREDRETDFTWGMKTWGRTNQENDHANTTNLPHDPVACDRGRAVERA